MKQTLGKTNGGGVMSAILKGNKTSLMILVKISDRLSEQLFKV